MRKPANLRWKLPLFLLCGGALAVWVVLKLPCPVRHLTGWICPGCGMGRAWLAALRLDLAAAFTYHPMFWSVPVVALFVLYDCRLFQKNWINVSILAALLAGLLICYLIRLLVFLGGSSVI